MRLIDADALKEYFKPDCPYTLTLIDHQPTIDIEERLNDAYAHGWSDAEAKFHDAVEVVRCRDCRWYDHICWRVEASDREFMEDDFCSYGERE